MATNQEVGSTFTPDDLREMALDVAQHYHVPRDMFLGIQATESDWRPNAQNPKSSALGLSQFVTGTAVKYFRPEWGALDGGPDDPRRHPGYSLDASARYLRDLYQETGNWQAAVMRYYGAKNAAENEAYLEKIKAAAGREADYHRHFIQRQFMDIAGAVDVGYGLSPEYESAKMPKERGQTYTQDEFMQGAGGADVAYGLSPETAEHTKPGFLYKQVREYLGLNHTPYTAPFGRLKIYGPPEAPTIYKRMAEEFPTTGLTAQEEADFARQREEEQQAFMEGAGGLDVGYGLSPSAAVERQVLPVVASFVDNLGLHVPSGLTKSLTGESFPHATEPLFMAMKEGAALAGQIAGPYRFLSTFTGSWLRPTAAGLGLTAKIIEGGIKGRMALLGEDMVGGAATLGLLQGLSRIVPAMEAHPEFKDWAYDVINHAKSGALVGAAFPLLSLVPGAGVPGRLARMGVGFAALDYMRAAPGKWSTLGDFYEAYQKWDTQSKSLFSQLAYQYIMDLGFASMVKPMREALQAHQLHDLVVSPEEFVRTVLGVTGQGPRPKLGEEVAAPGEGAARGRPGEVVPQEPTEGAAVPPAEGAAERPGEVPAAPAEGAAERPGEVPAAPAEGTAERPGEIPPAPAEGAAERPGEIAPVAPAEGAAAVTGPEEGGELRVAPSRQPVQYNLERAVERGDLATIIKARGGFDSQARIIREATSPEERKKLIGFVRSRAKSPQVVGPDVLLEDLKREYPHLFGKFESDGDLIRAIVDGTIYKNADYAKMAQDLEDYHAELERDAAAEGYSPEDVARAAAEDQELQRAERDAIQSEGSARDHDLSWELPELTAGQPQPSRVETRLNEIATEYPALDREKAATVLRALPEAENHQVAAMSADPEMFSQVARGNLAASERAQLLRKATDAGRQMGLELLYGGGPGTAQALKAVYEDTATLINRAPEKIQEASGFIKTTAKKLWDWYKTPFTATERGYHRIFNDYLGERQIAGYENSQFLKKIEAAVPEKFKRIGITNFIQAGGDETTLRLWAEASQGDLKKGYEAALQLTPEEQATAKEIAAQYAFYLREAQAAGIVENGLENYVNGMWKRTRQNEAATLKLRAEINAGLLNTNFNYARQKIFGSYFEGEQQGWTPYNKDIGFLLGHYHASMYEAISARRAIKALSEGQADDGRPLVAIGGRGFEILNPEELKAWEKVNPQYNVTEPKGPEAYLIKPRAKPEDTEDYLPPINHPALRKWKFVGKDPNGAPILMQGDMYIHPDIYTHLKNVLSRSWVREYALGRFALKVSQNLKGVLLSGLPTPFHQVHLGTHAIFHKVNPFDCPPLDFNDLLQVKAVKSGLMIYSHNALTEFAEGLQPTGLAHQLPGIGRVTQAYAEYLFQDLIPRFKMKLFKEAYERNLSRYAGQYTEDQIAEITANQANAAFGELNYKAMGRNPGIQDMLRLLTLAPDFLEARVRFLGQALKPGGKEQGAALLRAVIGMYGLGVIGNLILSGDGKPHWDRPFTLIVGETAYSLRSVPGDFIHLVNDARSFVYHRLNPTITKPLVEFLSGRDFYGRRRNTFEKVGDVFKGLVPIPLQFTVSGGERTILQGALQSMGVTSYKYRSPAADLLRQIAESKAFLNLSAVDRGKRQEMLKPAQAGNWQEFLAGLRQARAEGKVTYQQYRELREEGREIIRDPHLGPMKNSFKRLSLGDAIHVYTLATPDERAALHRIMADKWMHARPETRRAHREEFYQLKKAMGQ
jgi:preprotein translocase subunit Sss1